MTTTGANGDWIRTMIGALSAIVVTMGSLYSVVIIPQAQRIEKLEVGREKDGERLALLYTSIQTNDEYKKTISSWLGCGPMLPRFVNALSAPSRSRTDAQPQWQR
jgi:hypothetical protein